MIKNVLLLDKGSLLQFARYRSYSLPIKRNNVETVLISLNLLINETIFKKLGLMTTVHHNE